MNKRRRLPLAVVLAGAIGLTGRPNGEALYRTHSGVVSENPADDTPHILGDTEFPVMAGERLKVNAILPMGGRVYVGGTFTGVKEGTGSAKHARSGLFAIDAGTRKVVAGFVANFDGAVEALAPAPDG
ncbi:MAG: hypothetical protein ACRDY7_10825, partial [Acidimicrobiia bacterium]